MTHNEIADTLADLFGTSAIKVLAPGSWQVETSTFRLLLLLSDDGSWLRVLLPMMPAPQAQPFLEQFFEANFDDTQQVRYALHQEVLWGVFQHNCESLVVEDLRDAIARLISLYEVGLDDAFTQLTETKIKEIVQASKQQGKSLEATMQILERFYAEGLMGGIDQSSESREKVLTAWRRQLERLWNEQ
ncbi:MAG: leucine zipper domain-containing protein [Cyanobacteria bacterium J06635_10]